MPSIHALTTLELFQLHARIMGELRARKIIRISNNPIGDLAEHLFCRALGWTQSHNSNPSLDAVDAAGGRYQIKGRRLTAKDASRQLSAIRELEGAQFDVLAGALFSEDYQVIRAALIPHAIVVERATFVARTNSHKFFLRDEVWSAPGVRDVTAALNTVRL